MKPRLAMEWDRIVTSAPLNKDAAVARDNRGQGWNPARVYDGARHFAPLPMRPYPVHSKPEDDLTGWLVGRLSVLGLSEKGGAHGATWVVRCTCGAYETRRAKTLKGNSASGGKRLMCSACDYLEQLKLGKVPPKEI